MQIIRSKRKTIALIVTLEGSLIVRAPQRATNKQIEDLVREKAGWIEEKQALARQKAAQAPRPKTFREGDTFPYLGRLYILEVTNSGHVPLVFKDDRFQLHRAALPFARGAFARWYRSRARQHLAARVAQLSAQHGFNPGKVRITSARTRWGSCSSKGTLSFPWRLVMAPPDVVDYVIIHELCHLKEHNHSPRFWALVGAILPDYKSKLKWLKESSGAITALSEQLESQ
jgi:predicted metal-dependent hydrolase